MSSTSAPPRSIGLPGAPAATTSAANPSVTDVTNSSGPRDVATGIDSAVGSAGATSTSWTSDSARVTSCGSLATAMPGSMGSGPTARAVSVPTGDAAASGTDSTTVIAGAIVASAP